MEYVNRDLTEVIFLLDGSSSMDALRESVVEGVNAFIEEQREQPGECRISIHVFNELNTSYLFNNTGWIKTEQGPLDTNANIDTLRHNLSIGGVLSLDIGEYNTYGMTPLNDAIMEVADRHGQRYNSLPFPERPGKVVYFISTDGYENASRQWTTAQVKQFLEEQQNKYQWEVIFSSSDLRAEEQAISYGIDVTKTIRFNNDAESTRKLYGYTSCNVSSLRSREADTITYSDAQKLDIASDVPDEEIS